jgi:hypothetical protein
VKHFACVFLLLLSQTALAYGPGMHAREAAVVLELLVQSDGFWEEAAQVELAGPYLTLGSMSPDFQYAVDNLDFGHSKGLSYHLLAAAADMPMEYSLFALGHLAHAGGSDAASEQFVGPTVFALEPLGMFDIVAGQDGPRGESEGICEGFGDLMMGDYHRVADAIWYFWLEGDQAKVRGEEILTWYCTTGAAYSGTNTDCAAVWAGFEDLLGQAGGLLGGFDYQGTHDLVEMLLSQPPEDLADLVFAGSMGAFLNFEVGQGEHTEAEKERIKNSILMDPEFWNFYDEMAMIGPSVTAYFEAEKPAPGTWPTWSDKPQIFGNIRSVLNFMPSSFAPWPGLIVDDLVFRSPGGNTVTEIVSDTPVELEARVRLYAAFPFAGTVRGVVRQDRPGLSQSLDELVGEGYLAMDVDPADYGPVQRETLVIPFTADPEGLSGFIVELYLNEATLPWFTTSWDGIYPSGVLPFDWAVYKDNFGTYGHWPQSLPANGSQEGPTLFATVKVAPSGPGIAEAAVMVEELEYTTKDNGIAAIDDLASGAWAVKASAPGYQSLDTEPSTVALVDGAATWQTLYLHAVPEITLTSPWMAGDCLEVIWPLQPFGGQTDHFTVNLATAQSLDGTIEEVQAIGGPVEFCPPDGPTGAAYFVSVQAVYHDGTTGLLGWSGSLVAEEQPVVDVVEMPEIADIQEGEPDLWTLDVTAEEAYELVPETDLTREPEVPALDVGTDVGPGAPKSSGCSAGPNGKGATPGIVILLALLVLVAWSSRRHNIFRFPL